MDVSIWFMFTCLFEQCLIVLFFKSYLVKIFYIYLQDILWMSERDLKEIGIKNGSHRARMMSSLTILKGKYNKCK